MILWARVNKRMCIINVIRNLKIAKTKKPIYRYKLLLSGGGNNVHLVIFNIPLQNAYTVNSAMISTELIPIAVKIS